MMNSIKRKVWKWMKETSSADKSPLMVKKLRSYSINYSLNRQPKVTYVMSYVITAIIL